MSEVDARPPPTRGRSSYRGGRGGFGRGGPRGGRKPANNTNTDTTQIEDSPEDQGELGEMKKQYASELVMLKELFPDWTDVDLVFALQETDGDVPATVEHITQGSVSQFAEVKSTKDRARSKVKETSTTAGATEKPAGRGARGRGGFEGTRGGRGRGSDRGRGSVRGGRGGHATTNGAPNEAASTSVPTAESTAWDDSNAQVAATESSWDTQAQATSKDINDAGQSTWGNVVTSDSTPAAASEGAKSSLIPEGGPKKSWASMFAKPAAAPAKKTSQQPPAELVASGHVPAAPDKKQEEVKDAASKAPAPVIQELVESAAPGTEGSSPLDGPRSVTDGEELAITPSIDPLTEENVEHLPDESNPPATQTVASTTGSLDPRNVTPLPSQQAPIARPPMGGYATSAYRATGVPGRSASYQRRVQEQQEAVVMPGHNAVDRAAVQFGSMGLNGEPGPDVDEDREDPETRQAPQHSPPSQPRTSLPPAPRQTAAPQEPILPESLPMPKQAPGLPPASQQNQQQMQEATLASGMPNDPTQMPQQNYSQYGRYGQPGMQHDYGALPQKTHDPFNQQAPPSQYDQYLAHTQQAPQQPQHQQTQSGFGGLSSAPSEYSQYYTSDQQRSAYSNYYNSYGPQDVRSQIGPGQQEAGMGQQRSTSGFGTGPNESAFSSQAQHQVSISPSLLDLNTALNNCSNEGEKQLLLKEIQRVVSSAQIMPSSVPPFGMYSSAEEINVRDKPPDFLHQEQLQSSLFAPLPDVSNRKVSNPSPLGQSKVNTPHLQSKQAQSRFADTTGSGNNTPNPLVGGQQQTNPNAPQSQHSVHQQPSSHQQQAGYGANQPGYGYGHPYYPSPYHQAYQNQYGGYNQQQLGGYGGGYPGKQSGMYAGGSHGYGMAPQSSYDHHSASPANAGAFGQNQQATMRSASGMGSNLAGLDDYGRSSSQSAAHQQSSAFGGMNEIYTRSTSGFGGQSGYGQQSMTGPEDSLKPFADSKGGPSPALGQPGGRPGSAANSAGGNAQSSLPPPQSHQSGFGGYPGFTGQSGYGGLGGLGTQQQQHGQQQSTMGGQGGYGSYGAGGFGQTYGGYGSQRGGWGSNYGAH